MADLEAAAPLSDIERRTRRRIGMLPKQLAEQFESFGDNCEFGLVQRHFGAEPVGIFRFSNPKAGMILHGAKTNFAGLGQNLIIELDQQAPLREWIIVDQEYRLRQHSFIREDDPREASIQSDMRRHFAFLQRKLVDDIADASKVFVIKSVPNVPPELAAQIAVALRCLGPNWLLWVVDEPGGPAVEIAGDGLLKARVNGLQPEGHPQWGEFAFEQWLEVMTQALELIYR